MSHATVHVGDVLAILPTLAAGSVRCCVTSPPYFGLRDYGMDGQIGLEPTPDEYVAKLVAVFREVRRVLTDDGTLWLNLGDSYAGRGATGGTKSFQAAASSVGQRGWIPPAPGCKDKDLYGIPWRVAFALQADGWYLRSDIIWAKPNPMPESVTDRPTKAHEYVFLLSKQARYYYDAAAIAEPVTEATVAREEYGYNKAFRSQFQGSPTDKRHTEGKAVSNVSGSTRNARTVWPIATQPYPEAHFATFPEELPRRCLLAGSAPGDTVLDPFAGSGTTLAVATGHGRSAIGCELSPKYAELARNRIGPMLCTVEAE